VLKGETVDRWTQMITLTGVKGLAGNPRFRGDVAGSIAGGFKAACPDSFTATGFGATKFGDQDAYVAVASCGRVESGADKHSEVALVVSVKGSADYYTLQWRTWAFAGKSAIDEAKWQARCASCSRSGFADPARRAAPYPSCVGKISASNRREPKRLGLTRLKPGIRNSGQDGLPDPSVLLITLTVGAGGTMACVLSAYRPDQRRIRNRCGYPRRLPPFRRDDLQHVAPTRRRDRESRGPRR